MPVPTVLIVDDHAGFRAMACELLAAAGFRVVGEAGGGADAIVAAARLRPSVVVLDVQLPDFDGFEVTRRLLGAAEPPAVVLVSTREARDYGTLVDRSGAIGFITKARLTGDTLRAILRRQQEGAPR